MNFNIVVRNGSGSVVKSSTSDTYEADALAWLGEFAARYPSDHSLKLTLGGSVVSECTGTRS